MELPQFSAAASFLCFKSTTLAKMRSVSKPSILVLNLRVSNFLLATAFNLFALVSSDLTVTIRCCYQLLFQVDLELNSVVPA